MNNIAIIFAGGSGVRMGAGIPKQFLEVNGKPIICHTLEKFQYNKDIKQIYIACISEYIDYMWSLVDKYELSKVKNIVSGGDTGQDSIYRALKAAAEDNLGSSVVLIHDGVRPFITDEVISKNISSVLAKGSAITCTPCFETVIISEDGKSVSSIPLRKNAYTAQAPQSFYLEDILEAHENIRSTEEGYENIVDSCNLYKKLGRNVYMIEGNKGNIKVTTPEDFYILRALLQYKENQQIMGLPVDEGVKIKEKIAC